MFLKILQDMAFQSVKKLKVKVVLFQQWSDFIN